MFGLTLIKTSDLATLKDRARDSALNQRALDEAWRSLSAGEFSAAKTLQGKVDIAVFRLGEARENAFANRQRALTLEHRLDEALAELAHWKANAQLRDPKTGRLIPRVKTDQAA